LVVRGLSCPAISCRVFERAASFADRGELVFAHWSVDPALDAVEGALAGMRENAERFLIGAKFIRLSTK
jgi:hypothetical protein